MAFTSAGLANNGRTTHYQISYDTTLSPADGVNRAAGLLAACEQDFTLMTGWFGGISLEFQLPIDVQITTNSGGASWTDPSNAQRALGYTMTVNINPGSGTSVNFVRYLLVSEVTEMFMASQGKGWYENPSLFSGADEGSKGEGLSRFLGAQFQIANGLGSAPPPGFSVVPFWLNPPSTRADFVDTDPDDHNPDPTTGCTTCFIYYLHSQLGHSINAIVAAASSNLAGVYQNLTGAAGGWAAFSSLVGSHYPLGPTYHPAGDNIFPVSALTQFYAPNQITCGYSQPAQIFIGTAAQAEVNIQLTSDNPAVVKVPAQVTIPVGSTFTSVTISAPAIAGPFATKSVNVHATYAGVTLTIAVEVVPPAVATLTLNPSTVTCGDSLVATVTLNEPSLAGSVVVDLTCAAPGFANVPTQVTILQDKLSATFTITTPNILVAFNTAHAGIYATYASSSASAILTVESRVVAGIVYSLVVFPTSVPQGGVSRGTVTLVAAVPVATVVGLAAIAGSGPVLPGNSSPIATVPASITIPAGATTALFNITTKHTGATATQTASIMASAIVSKYAMLTVTA